MNLFSNELKDTYLTVAKPSEGEFRDRGSKFIASAYFVRSEAEIKHCLEEIRKKHPKATHVCYAYRLGIDKLFFRANDDGEPAGTAGKPILGQIDSFQLSNVLIAVVRYFGGTLLGVSGLINAYRNAAKQALEHAEIIEKIVDTTIEVKFEYINMNQIMGIIKEYNLPIVQQFFFEEPSIQINIRQSLLNTVLGKFEEVKGTVLRQVLV